MRKSRLHLVSPPTVKRTVTPTRRPNIEIRPREHLTEREVENLIEADYVATDKAGNTATSTRTVIVEAPAIGI